MKKLIILSAAVLALSACACFDSEEEAEEAVVYKTAQPKEMNCDYFDGKTCYRYVRRTRQIVAPAPVVRYREVARPCPQVQCAPAPVVVPAPAPMPAPLPAPVVAAPCPAAPCVSNNSCAPKVSETREPVEVTYKKTTYTTVYEPKTSASVNYEKVAVTGGQNLQVVQPQVAPLAVTVSQPQPQTVPVEVTVSSSSQTQTVPVEVKTVAQPQPQITVTTKPVEHVEYDSDEEILLNVK